MSIKNFKNLPPNYLGYLQRSKKDFVCLFFGEMD